MRGRPRSIHLAAREGLVDYISSCEQSPTLDEMQAYLFEEFNIETHVSTISRCLKSNNISYKKSERIHPNRDERLRGEFFIKMGQYRASQLVVVDESATNERGLDRRWGWSSRGTAYRMVSSSAARSKCWSILPAFGINGYLEVDIHHGSFNSERFVLFVRKLLNKMTPFPGPRSVLVLDNAATHHAVEIGELCERAGVLVEYLPPYSLDMSPIEPTFSVLKSWIRRNRALGVSFLEGDLYGFFLHIAVAESNVGPLARGFFRSCGYVVEDEDTDVDYSTLEVGGTGEDEI